MRKKATSPSELVEKKIAPRQELSQNCDELGWTFNVYVSSAGSNALQKLINEADPAVAQYFKTRIRYLANTPKPDWKKPHARKLKGVKDLYEIRFEANHIQHRPLGFFGPGKKEFTILIWATHKQNIYEPAEAIKTADNRRGHIQNGTASCLPLKIDGEEFPCATKR